MIRRLFNLVLEGRCVFNLAQLFMSSIELPGSWVDHGAYLQFAHGFICIGMDMEKLGLGRLGKLLYLY
jgi:hypothetical protein